MFDTPQLRINRSGNQLPWSDDELLAGLRHFYNEFGHYPSAGEFDTYKYLPSARSIQRAHGGLVALRKRLLPEEDADHTRGERRKQRASLGDARARAYEEEFYLFLSKHFQEIALHEQKVIRPGNVACDICIYTNYQIDHSIVIDLFYAQDLVTLLKIVAIKVRRYNLIPYKTFFVLVGNDAISQVDIDKRIANKSTALPGHITVLTEQSFKSTEVVKIKQQSIFTL